MKVVVEDQRTHWMCATSLSLVKPLLRERLMPVASFLFAAGVTANQVTVLSIICSIALGLLQMRYSESLWVHAVVPVWLIVRTLMASLDGTPA